MLYALLHELQDISPDLQILRYLTVRMALAALTSFLLCVMAGPVVIRFLARWGIGEDTEKSDSAELNRLHASKKNTPTMGGIIFLPALLGSVLLWGRLDNPYVVLTMFVTVTLGVLGFVDDYIKLTAPDKPGLRARTKLGWQVAISALTAIVLMGVMEVRLPEPPSPTTPTSPPTTEPTATPVGLSGAAAGADRASLEAPPAHARSLLPLVTGADSPRYVLRDDSGLATSVFVPFFKRVRIPLGALFLLFAVCVVTGSSNAVNLTDGLDGLAVGSLILVSGTFALVSYVVGRLDFAGYLQLPYVPGSGELAIFCTAMMGAGMGFLWHNCHPATVFLGDTGALPLGGAIGTIAISLKQEALLLVAGGIFVAEALSVMIQVSSFKLFGRRVFKIAPLHHHFQFLGWPENKVTVRFWIIGAILALLSLMTLKVR